MPQSNPSLPVEGCPDLVQQRERSREALHAEAFDFTATYMAVRHLKSLVQSDPRLFSGETVTSLHRLLGDPAYRGQTQAYFLYREAAESLSHLIQSFPGENRTSRALWALLETLRADGPAQRAAAETLGALPLTICGPHPASLPPPQAAPRVAWEQVVKEHPCGPLRLMGRSIVAPLQGRNELLVVKLALLHHCPDTLIREAQWLCHFHSQMAPFAVRFDIPVPLMFGDSFLFRLQDLPLPLPKGMRCHPDGYALACLAHRDYFTYPNGTPGQSRLSPQTFLEVMGRNSFLLGALASQGIVHRAPIPLFHNRVQRFRRPDRGRYLWTRGGRLDRWLHSCAFPNLGLTGIRDFEHFHPFQGGSRRLFFHLGVHLLSLLLVAGSYFRNRDPDRVGLDERGQPVDARGLFDEDLLRDLICRVFTDYFHGFVGKPFAGDAPVSWAHLTHRMIEEMGVDRHMEEILRRADQEEMTDRAFDDFVREHVIRGNPGEPLRRSAQDLTVISGPHLGGFNQRISLPEMTRAVGSMCALCILGRYQRDQNLPPSLILPHGPPPSPSADSTTRGTAAARSL